MQLLGFADAAAAPADVVDVLLGDLNTYSDYEAPIDLATRAGWRDGAPLAERGSGTFPSWAPIHRPDRILLRLPRTPHLDVGYQLLGAPPAHVTTVESAKRFAASDHLAERCWPAGRVRFPGAEPPSLPRGVPFRVGLEQICAPPYSASAGRPVGRACARPGRALGARRHISIVGCIQRLPPSGTRRGGSEARCERLLLNLLAAAPPWDCVF